MSRPPTSTDASPADPAAVDHDPPPTSSAEPGDDEQGTTGRNGAGRRFLIALGLIALAALAVRVGFTVVVDPQVPAVSDASAYHMLGGNLAEGRGYIRPFDRTVFGEIRPTAEYPPLLPGLLALANLLGINSVDGQQLVLCLVGTGTVVVIGLLGRRVGGETVGLVAAGIAAVYPMLFQSDAILMPETPFTFLVASGLLAALVAAERRTPARFAISGALLGLAALTRAEGVLLSLLVLLPLAALLREERWRRRLLLGAVGVAATAAVVVPWTIRNAVAFDGAFVPISNNLGTALDGANCDQTWYGPRTGLWLYECFGGFTGATDLSEQTEAEAAAIHRSRGLDYIAEHPRRLPVVLAVREGRTWGVYAPRQQVRIESFEGRTVGWQTAGTVMYWVLVPFAVIGAVQIRRRRTVLWPLLATVVGVAVTAAVTYGNQRFRVAAEPAIVTLAATGLLAAVARLRGADGSEPTPRRRAGRGATGTTAR